MNRERIKKTWVVIFVIISSVLLGDATSWKFGTSLFFAMWAIAGMFELLEEKISNGLSS